MHVSGFYKKSRYLRNYVTRDVTDKPVVCEEEACGERNDRGGEEKREKKRTETMQRKRKEGWGEGGGKGKKRSNTENEFIDLSEIEIIESLGG